jgi:hypothetical protein
MVDLHHPGLREGMRLHRNRISKPNPKLQLKLHRAVRGFQLLQHARHVLAIRRVEGVCVRIHGVHEALQVRHAGLLDLGGEQVPILPHLGPVCPQAQMRHHANGPGGAGRACHHDADAHPQAACPQAVLGCGPAGEGAHCDSVEAGWSFRHGRLLAAFRLGCWFCGGLCYGLCWLCGLCGLYMVDLRSRLGLRYGRR